MNKWIEISVHHAGVDDGPGLQWDAIRHWHVEHNEK
jgi:hypothetical protein